MLAACERLRQSVPAETPLLVGVSGGRDSIALLDALLDTGFTNLTVCHLDHRLRRESAADAAWVRKFCAERKIPAVIGRADVSAMAKRNHISIETAARQARLEFFARVARSKKCDTVVLAHHADDLVETFLFNLFRGAAARGLSGIRECTLHRIGRTELTIRRPLLTVWREEIAEFVAQRGLQFREDLSNADPAFTRNRLRHEVIPLLENVLGREVRRSILRTAQTIQAEDEFLANQVPEPIRELSTKDLKQLPLALQRRLLHRWMIDQKLPSVGFDEVEKVRALLTSTTAKMNLPGGNHVCRRAGKLFVETAG